jgi:peptide/nickel transport system substrate-binding protein
VSVPADGGELREGLVGLPRTVNPVLAVSDVDRDISALVYAGLTRHTATGISNDLAKSYTVSDNGLTYTFTLRDGLRFQDGTALTADDVAFTIDKIQDPVLKSPHAGDWANVTVKQVSSSVIQFTLKQAYAPFISETDIGILPKHIWGSVSDDQFIFSQYNIQPIGAGPYRSSSIARDSGGIPTEYRLAAWSGYAGVKPHVSNITFVFFNDDQSAYSALDSGSIDSLPSVSPDEAARLASDSAQSYTVLSDPLPRVFGVFFNQSQNAALADKSVRQALDMSVDRNAIVRAVLSGYGTPISGPLPAGMSASSSAPIATSSNIANAQTLLEKNGWKRDSATGIYQYQKKGSKTVTPLAFDIYTADTPDLKQAAELVKDSWAKIGADVGVKVFESSDLYQSVIRPRKYDALLFGELIGKDRDLYAFWHSSQRSAPGLNVSMYANSKADKLLEQIRTTSSDSARASEYAQFEQQVRSDIPAIFLYSPDFIYAVPKALQGLELGELTVPSDRFDSVDDWYIETENVWTFFAKYQK